jgi:hypothetical protein
MTTPAKLHTVQLPGPATKFERERQAFHRLLPELLKTHRGRYVAIHNEQMVDEGPDRLSVAMRVLQQIGNVDIYVGLVSEQKEPVSRSGVIRLLEDQGGHT